MTSTATSPSPACRVVREARGRVDGDGIRLAFAHWPGPGTPIVGLHGNTSNALFYGGVAERLAGRRPLLALDLRGRGDADKPVSGYGLDQHADDVAAALRALGTDRAVVVGHSFGAAVAHTIARRHPDLCAGVVLYDGGHQALAVRVVDQEAAEEFIRSSAAVDGRIHREYTSLADYVEHWRGLSVFSGERWGPWVERYLDYDFGADLRPKCTTDSMAEDTQSLLDAAFGEDDQRVDVPVLHLCAEEGMVDGTRPLVPDAALAAMERDYPSFRAERLPGTNHYTIALSDPGATRTADHLVAFAAACGL